MDRILISGLREAGIHGVLPEEQVRPQPFAVDVELTVDLRAAGASDDLDDTVDYGTLADRIRAVVAGESCRLIETLATRIADLCRADPRVTAAVVEVRKLEPPIDGAIGHVAVRIER
ncbi:MAG: dihydroneopterin aldolase [Actinomycetota bacterium]